MRHHPRNGRSNDLDSVNPLELLYKVMQRSLTQSVLFLLLPVVLSAGLYSCATQERKEPVEPTAAMSVEEQDKRAFELFSKIADIFDGNTRKAALPKAEELYLKIINDYPRAALGEECYWRLILIYVRDSSPRQFDKAELYYGRFISKYPGSQFRRELEDAITEAYASEGRWADIVAFYKPAIKRYIETGKLERPQEMFRYSEAKRNLGDVAEAEKGYNIVLALFPSTREGGLAKQRLSDIITKRNTEKK